MVLFTRRDRIAIAVICTLIVAGWGIRHMIDKKQTPGEIKVIRNAVEPPSFFSTQDSVQVSEAKSSGIVNINSAGAEALEMLPMIGPTRAAAIIRYRHEHGVFSKPEDIMNVQGIGPGIFGNIKVYITVSDTLAAQ
ncbi:ComEA family DNA-binding protein [Candidatus Latescibacterota bacterium]